MFQVRDSGLCRFEVDPSFVKQYEVLFLFSFCQGDSINAGLDAPPRVCLTLLVVLFILFCHLLRSAVITTPL